MTEQQKELYNKFIEEKSYLGEKESGWTPARIVNVSDLDKFIDTLTK